MSTNEHSTSRAGWLLCAVPLIAIVEFIAHVGQTASVVPDGDWTAARDLVKADLKPDDLVVFAPFWSDALGRRSFGAEIATLKREGSSDERRWARAYEVSIRGAHIEALASWKKVKEQKAGAITVTLLENPSYTPVIDDLVELATIPDRLTVSRVDGGSETTCAFQKGPTSGGSTVVPQGLLVPGDKFVCPNGHVGVATLHALDHHPHLCLFATPMQGAILRLKFSNVTFGPSLFGHSGIQWVAERTPAPEKVTVSFYSNAPPTDGTPALGPSLIGTHAHRVGVGWVGFELPTQELDGKKADLIAEVGPSAHHQFCFEATTRRAPK